MSALRIAVPGQPVRLVPDPDPYLGLTQRQRQILEVVRSHGGNRSRAARQLGVNVACVQVALRYARRAGALVPVGRTRKGIPNREPMRVGPRCDHPMPLSATRCARPHGHSGGHTSPAAWSRGRAA